MTPIYGSKEPSVTPNAYRKLLNRLNWLLFLARKQCLRGYSGVDVFSLSSRNGGFEKKLSSTLPWSVELSSDVESMN